MCECSCDPELEKTDRKQDLLLKKIIRYGTKIDEMKLDAWSSRTFTLYQKAINELFELVKNDYESNARFQYTISVIRNPANITLV